jgi:hypothetical protein
MNSRLIDQSQLYLFFYILNGAKSSGTKYLYVRDGEIIGFKKKLTGDEAGKLSLSLAFEF